MTTPASGSTPDLQPTEPKGRPPKSAAGLEAQGAPTDAVAQARKNSQDAAAAAEQARIAKATADEAAFKAKAAEKSAKEAKEDKDRLAAARKHLRAASPDDPIALRRLECMSAVGDTLYGLPRNTIDLKNSEYAGVTLLYDGQVVHVINATLPERSFWVGPANIAGMYPRLDA